MLENYKNNNSLLLDLDFDEAEKLYNQDLIIKNKQNDLTSIKDDPFKKKEEKKFYNNNNKKNTKQNSNKKERKRERSRDKDSDDSFSNVSKETEKLNEEDNKDNAIVNYNNGNSLDNKNEQLYNSLAMINKKEIEDAIEEAQRQAQEAKRYDCTVLMYSLGSDVNEKRIFEFFCKYNVLPIFDIKLLRDPRTRKSKNCCYVEFQDLESAKKAISLSGQNICGQSCQIVASQYEKNKQASEIRFKKEQLREQNKLAHNIVKYDSCNLPIDPDDPPMKIYVGGLTENLADITEDELKDIFNFGEIDSIELHRDIITGKSKGYAFIQFHRGSKARESILTMNGFIYNGKNLRVGEANENNTVIRERMNRQKEENKNKANKIRNNNKIQINNDSDDKNKDDSSTKTQKN